MIYNKQNDIYYPNITSQTKIVDGMLKYEDTTVCLGHILWNNLVKQ